MAAGPGHVECVEREAEEAEELRESGPWVCSVSEGYPVLETGGAAEGTGEGVGEGTGDEGAGLVWHRVRSGSWVCRHVAHSTRNRCTPRTTHT